MPLWLLLLLMALATYRLTRLVVADTFPPVLRLRDRLAGGWRPPTLKEQHHELFPHGLGEGQQTTVPGLGTIQVIDGDPQVYARKARWSPWWLAELVSCPWCASAWIAAAITAAVAFTVGVPAPLLAWLAVWAVGALIAAQEWA